MKPFGILFICLFLLVQTSSVVRAGEFQTIQLRGDKTDNFSGIVFGPVENDDTLWNIARDYRNSDFFAGPRPRSLYPVMYGIYQLNPRAFQNNNVNALLNNAMLEMPTADYINQLDLREAKAKIEGDESLWRNIRAGGIEPQSAPEPEAVSMAEPVIAVPEVVVSELPDSKPVPLDSGPSQPQLAINEVVTLNDGAPTSLNASEMALLNELKSQYAISLETIQVLLDENDRLLERIEQQNLRIDDVDKRIDTDIQTQIDALAALQSEIYQTLLENGQLDEKKSSWQHITDFLSQTYVFLSLSALSVIVILIAVGLKLFYKRPNYAVDDDEISESFEDDLLNDDATSDVLAELKADPEPDSLSTDELIADIDESLIQQDDLVSQPVADNTTQSSFEDAADEVLSLDDDDLLDLDDELMVPDVEVPSEDAEKALREEIAEIEFEASDSSLSQDDLDDLFNTPTDETDGAISLNDDLADFDIAIQSSEGTNNQGDEIPSDEIPGDEPLKDDVLEVETGSLPEQDNVEAPVQVADETVVLSASDTTELADAEPSEIDDILSEQTAELPDDLGIDELAPLDADAFDMLNEEIESQSSQIDKDVDAIVRELDQIDMMEQMLGNAQDAEPSIAESDTALDTNADMDKPSLSDDDTGSTEDAHTDTPDIEIFTEDSPELEVNTASKANTVEPANVVGDEDTLNLDNSVDDLDVAIEELLNADMSDETVQADADQNAPDSVADNISQSPSSTATPKLSTEDLLQDLPDIDGWLSDDNDVISEIENTSFDDLLNSIDADEPNKEDDALLKAQKQFAELDQLPSLDSIEEQPGDIATELPDFIDVDSLLEDSKSEVAQEPELDVTKNIADQLPEATDVDADLNSETLGKLDLARAYIEIDEFNDAKSLLEQVVQHGNDEEVDEATSLLTQLNDLIKSS